MAEPCCYHSYRDHAVTRSPTMKEFGKNLIKRSIVINALGIALVVGTLLNAINQGSQLISGIDIAWAQVVLNYVVPYCVASFSAAKNEMHRNKQEAND